MYSKSFPLNTTVEALKTGQVDLSTYLNAICDRIETIEPEIEALLPETGRRERLLREAQELQERFSDPADRPSLYGILLGVKDVLRADGFLTRAGSQLPSEIFAGPEASCVSKLRAAGALVLGKTVSTEFAYFAPGSTRNPYQTSHTPGGSSSGSAAAVAAGYCQLALGTQTSGSTIRPAAYCGLFGFKPGYGRIATDGLIYCAESLDTIGYLTQDLSGARLVAPLLCNDWKSVPECATKPVLAVPEGPYLALATDEALTVFEQQLMALEQAGYTLKRVPMFQDIEAIVNRHNRLVLAEMASAHKRWFGEYEILYRTLTAQAIREGQRISYPTYDLYRSSPAALRIEVETLMDVNEIDLWVCPAATGAAPEGIDTTGSPAMNIPWTHAGLPALTLPLGTSASGLPMGLQCVGRFQQDELLLNYAAGIAEVFEFS